MVKKASIPKDSKAEVKVYDYTSLSGSLGAYPSAWSSFFVPAITQGVTRAGRLGNQVWSSKLEIKTGVLRNAAGSAVQRVRMLVLCTKNSAGFAADATEVFFRSERV